jgi:hypothetical protein
MKYRGIKKAAYEAIVQGFICDYDDVLDMSCSINHYCVDCPATKYCATTTYGIRFKSAVATVFKDHLELRI